MAYRESIVQTMGFYELKEFIAAEKEKGSGDIAFYEIELYQRTSFPFATYVLTLIGMAVSSQKTRGGVGVNIRSEEHTSELQSRPHLVCRLLLEKKKKKN